MVTIRCIFWNLNKKNLVTVVQEEIGYSIATKFEMVVPVLDNDGYSFNYVFKSRKNDPVAITVGSNMKDNIDCLEQIMYVKIRKNLSMY